MMKLALVYDRVNKFGGAERVLLALHELWPDAPLYTSVYDSRNASWAKDFRVIPSFLQNVPFIKNRHEGFFWLMPLAFESFDFSEYDVVISITSEYAKGIITKPRTLHLCYCLTPTRYLWSGQANYVSNPFLRWLSKPIVKYFQNYDRIIAQRPDSFIAISETVRERIKKYYGRVSQLVYPPIDTNVFNCHSVPDFTKATPLPSARKDEVSARGRLIKNKLIYYLVVSRLVKYKKIDLVIKTFNELGWNLVIIGTGAEEQKLKRIAKSNIHFLGQLTDEEIVSYYQKCLAVIFPTEEDFGIVPLEAQACGKPVIAYRKGGATETVIEGTTGEFFNNQTVQSLKGVLLNFIPEMYQPTDCRKQAEKFSNKVFQKNMQDYLNHLISIKKQSASNN